MANIREDKEVSKEKSTYMGNGQYNIYKKYSDMNVCLRFFTCMIFGDKVFSVMEITR